MIFTKEYRHYRQAVLFSLLLALFAAAFVLLKGKENSFLVINKLNSPAFDYVFSFWTYLGHGMIWVPLILYAVLFKKEFLFAIVLAIIISTLMTLLLKKVLFPYQMRPILMLDEENIHFLRDVRMNKYNSFPSGHTSTAFTLALLMAFIIRGNFWIYFFPLVAFFVGYSRVYLAQHFVTDVFAGMMVGIVSSYLSLRMYEQYKRRKKDNMNESDLNIETTSG